MASQGNRWKLEDAKARFSALVRSANTSRPQRVTARGQDREVVISVEDYDRLKASPQRHPIVTLLESLALADLDLVREEERGRDFSC